MLTAEEVVKYTYENVICENDNWNPRMFMEKVDKPDDLVLDGERFPGKHPDMPFAIWCSAMMK